MDKNLKKLVLHKQLQKLDELQNATNFIEEREAILKLSFYEETAMTAMMLSKIQYDQFKLHRYKEITKIPKEGIFKKQCNSEN